MVVKLFLIVGKGSNLGAPLADMSPDTIKEKREPIF